MFFIEVFLKVFRILSKNSNILLICLDQQKITLESLDFNEIRIRFMMYAYAINYLG